MNEHWKEIPSALHYEASSLGNIRSWKSRNGRGLAKTPRIMSTYIDKDGYRVVMIRTSIKKGPRKVCGLIAEAFYGPRPKGCVVRHLNGKSNQDNFENLSWGTQKENVADAKAHGTLTKGERIGNSKLTAKAVAEIYSSKIPKTILASKFGVALSTIYRVTSGKTWSHVHRISHL